MRVLVIHGKLDMRVEDRDLPLPGDGHVRLRVAYAGVCGSDLHYYFDGANAAFVVREPLIPGHELSATVDLDPSGRFESGTPVTVHPATFGSPRPGLEGMRHLWPLGAYLGSASTTPHTQGGMAEYITVRSDMLRVLPDGLPLDRAALAEPLAVGLHGIAQAGGVEGKKVLVSGAGPIGLLAAAAAITRGAAEVVVTDVLDGPLERALAVGATSTVRAGADELPGEYFDVVLECSAAPPAISAALNAVRRAGTVAQIGMVPGGTPSVALAPLIAKEVRLVGCFRFNDEIDEAVQILASTERMDAVITHVMPADDPVGAFEIAKDAQMSGKVLVDLGSSASAESRFSVSRQASGTAHRFGHP